ncbi:MAG: carbamate kinase [Gaiellaceae bacterium]
MTVVVALGGNALIRPGERGTAAEQLANLRATCEALRPLLGEPRLAITHGNGPQVGQALLRQERAAAEVPPLPLHLAVAETQATIGAMIATEVGVASRRAVACLLTRVVVDPDDPAFARPTKPVGPFYAEAEARRLERDLDWVVQADAGRGWRRVVPSPAPREIVELDAIRSLLDIGSVTVCCGGGGIPVARRNGRLNGVEGVIDKDRASALLAAALGAERLVILTDVAAVAAGFGTGEENDLRALTPDDADALLPELAAGSMGPKVEAAARYVRESGGEALITSADALAEALAGRAGTRVAA